MGLVVVIASLDLASYYFLKCEYIIHRKDKINPKLRIRNEKDKRNSQKAMKCQ